MHKRRRRRGRLRKSRPAPLIHNFGRYQTVEILERPALLSNLALAKARVQRRYPRDLGPASNAGQCQIRRNPWGAKEKGWLAASLARNSPPWGCASPAPCHPPFSLYARAIPVFQQSLSGLSLQTVQDELAKLEAARLITSRSNGYHRFYRADSKHPLYANLRKLVVRASARAKPQPKGRGQRSQRARRSKDQ